MCDMAKQSRLVKTKSGAIRENKSLKKKAKALNPIKYKASGKK